MSVVINCNKCLVLEKRDGDTVSIKTDDVHVEIYNYPLSYVNEISFRSFTNSPALENSPDGEKSACSIRITLQRGGEYIFKYSEELLHCAFSDYIMLKSILKGHMAS
jgi:hypothetical protein